MSQRTKKKPAFEKIAEDLASLHTARSRARYLARRKGSQQRRIMAQLVDASRTNLRIDTHKALSLAEAAVTIARRLRDKSGHALSLRSKANALYVLGDNQASLKCHAQALRMFRAAGDTMQEARTLNASIQPHILLGEYEEAFEAAKAAEKLFARAGDERHLAHLQINIGNIYHRQDRFEEGLASYQRAYEKLLTLRDSEGLAVALYNISVCLIALNDFTRALDTYRRAREMCAQDGMTLLVGQADYNIAYLYYLRGEYAHAIDMLRAAREISEKNSDQHILALCHLDLSEIYLELNLIAEASETAHEGFQRFAKLGMRYEEAKCIANEALAHGLQSHASRALELFEQARAAFHREKNAAWCSLIDLYQALVLYNEGRLEESRRFCQQAFEFFGSSTLEGKAASCCLLLARIDLKEKKNEACRTRCHEALRRLSKLELPALNFQANLLMGQAVRALGHHELAHSFYETAYRALEALRSGLHKDEFKVAFMANKLDVYECLVELCLDDEGRALRKPEEAFEYIEAAKSRSLMELMSQDSLDLRTAPGDTNVLVRQIRDLRAELNWYYHRIEQEQLRPEANAAERIKNLRVEANAREKALARRVRELPDSEPEALLLRGPAKIPLREIQSGLAATTLIVEYFTLEDRLLAALISSSHIKILQVSTLSKVVASLRFMRFQLSKLSLSATNSSSVERISLEATQKHLCELYTKLIEPLGSLEGFDHLVFVPHGQLYALPFQALCDGERYLIDRFSISYSPSASIYRMCQRRPSPNKDCSLVLGVPDQRAPFIRDEISAVSATMKSPEVFLGEQVTEEVLRDKGPKAHLIHIATHATFRQDNPMFSRISLGQRYLNVLDLYRLRLPADLITLSGCATGLNVVTSGDEPLGLMRGLLGAGAKSLLLTLWDVNDRSTTEFMKAFYRYFSEGRTKAESLRHAVRKTRQIYPHPYYWAPFFLVGDAMGEGLR